MIYPAIELEGRSIESCARHAEQLQRLIDAQCGIPAAAMVAVPGCAYAEAVEAAHSFARAVRAAELAT